MDNGVVSETAESTTPAITNNDFSVDNVIVDVMSHVVNDQQYNVIEGGRGSTDDLTTRKPTTTTPKPTTQPPTSNVPRPTTRRSAEDMYEESSRPQLRPRKWAFDTLLDMWVLKLGPGGILIATPGNRARKVPESEYVNMRLKKLGRPTVMPTTTTRRPTTTTTRRPTTTTTRRPTTRRPITDAPVERVLGGDHEDMKADSPPEQTSGSRNSSYDNAPQEMRLDDRVFSNGFDRYRNSSTHHRGQTHHRRRHHHTLIRKVRIRLAGGRSSSEGRLEILPPAEHTWGVVCGQEWGIREAMVACNHLGLGYRLQNVSKALFGGERLPKYFYSIRCTGNEDSLHDCQWLRHAPNGGYRCRRANLVAGVVCARSLPDLVPSTTMVMQTQFLQDRYLYYLECAMEENCLASSAYHIRRYDRGWRHRQRRLLRFSSVVHNRGTKDFRPLAQRHEWEWHACHRHYHSMDVFAHYDITDSNGNLRAEGLKASFCLEDSACSSGYRPRYSCTNYGQQGISVGCSDNYMHDIDCQWIDITDLSPGNYTFKIEVNPKMLVPEMSFDNNVVLCDLRYERQFSTIRNCKLTSLL